MSLKAQLAQAQSELAEVKASGRLYQKVYIPVKDGELPAEASDYNLKQLAAATKERDEAVKNAKHLWGNLWSTTRELYKRCPKHRLIEENKALLSAADKKGEV